MRMATFSWRSSVQALLISGLGLWSCFPLLEKVPPVVKRIAEAYVELLWRAGLAQV